MGAGSQTEGGGQKKEKGWKIEERHPLGVAESWQLATISGVRDDS